MPYNLKTLKTIAEFFISAVLLLAPFAQSHPLLGLIAAFLVDNNIVIGAFLSALAVIDLILDTKRTKR